MAKQIRTLIIGIGNPLRSDDGAGWKIAQELSQELEREDVRVVAAHQLTPEMAELASRADRVVFIDAARGGEAGSLQCKRVAPCAPSDGFSHELSAAGIVALAQELYGHAPVAYSFTIDGESFATGDHLSATVTAALPQLKSAILRFLDQDEIEGLE